MDEATPSASKPERRLARSAAPTALRIVHHEKERQRSDPNFAPGPVPGKHAGRGHRRGLDGPSMPKPCPGLMKVDTEIGEVTWAGQMTSGRVRYEESFKLQVVQMVKVQGLRISDVCKDLRIGESA